VIGCVHWSVHKTTRRLYRVVPKSDADAHRVKGRSHCVRCRTTSDTQGRTTPSVRRRAWSYDVVRPRMCCVCRLVHTNNKMATEDDVYDVVLASSSYLYTFGKFSRRQNRQTRPPRFWVHDVLRRDDLGEYARLRTRTRTSAEQ